MSETDRRKIEAPAKVAWHTLSKEKQTELLVAFGYHLDQLPPTCAMEAKEARLRDWLDRRGVAYPGTE